MSFQSQINKVINGVFDNTLVKGLEIAVPVVVIARGTSVYDPATGTTTISSGDDQSVNAIESDYNDFQIIASEGAIQRGDKRFLFRATDLSRAVQQGDLIVSGGKTFEAMPNIGTTKSPFDADDDLFYDVQGRERSTVS